MVTSGQVASIARSFRSRATRRISGDTPWAENSSVAPSGTSARSSTNVTPRSRKWLDDVLVVDDLVVDVDRRAERPERQLQRLDRHVDAGTKSTRTRQENLHALHDILSCVAIAQARNGRCRSCCTRDLLRLAAQSLRQPFFGDRVDGLALCDG